MSSRKEYGNKIEEIVGRRLAGDPVAQIAADMRISRQYIYRIMNRLPKNIGKHRIIDTVDGRTALQIATAYLKLVPGERNSCRRPAKEKYLKACEDVAEKYKVHVETVLAILVKITEHHPTVTHTPYYETLQAWRAENSVSLSELSKYAGCSTAQMRDILRGWRHMPLRAAEGIRKRTGLKIGEIYAELVAMDRSEMREVH